MQLLNARATVGRTGKLWSHHCEASLNWLALGLLLAAWNAADDDAGGTRPRPPSLRGYSYVSVRAVARSEALER